MSDDQPPEGGSQRMRDIPQAKLISSPETYSFTAEGPTRRAALRDDAGQALGYVWTDDQRAAGFVEEEEAAGAGVKAFAYVWAVHRRAYRLGMPASSVLDPTLYAPMYLLDG